MYTHRAILLGVLFHGVIIASNFTSENVSGISNAIFIELEKLNCQIRFLIRVFINFNWEKLLSTEAVLNETLYAFVC